MWIGEAKSGLCCAVGKHFRRKRNPETYPCLPIHYVPFPIHYVHREAAPRCTGCSGIPTFFISEFTPYFDVVGIEIEMLQEDGVDVATDGGVTVTEDAGDAFELLPYAVLYVDRMTASTALTE